MLIVDTNNPNGCNDCPIFDCEKRICKVRNKNISSMPPSECPIIDNENGWVSVKDRLPEKSGDYLVSTIDMQSFIDHGDDFTITRIARYAHPDDYGMLEGEWRELPFDECKVIAWQPLPESYKLQESEE